MWGGGGGGCGPSESQISPTCPKLTNQKAGFLHAISSAKEDILGNGPLSPNLPALIGFPKILLLLVSHFSFLRRQMELMFACH